LEDLFLSFLASQPKVLEVKYQLWLAEVEQTEEIATCLLALAPLAPAEKWTFLAAKVKQQLPVPSLYIPLILVLLVFLES
jgi:hypothetical protein